MSELKQKRLLEHRQFQILDDGVQIEIASWPHRESYKVPFEQISNEIKEATEAASSAWLWSGAFLVFVGITALYNFLTHQIDGNGEVALIFLSLGIAGIARYFLSIKHYIGIVHPEQPIILIAGRPSESEVSEFLNSICDARDEYLRTNYSVQAQGVSPLEYLERLAALHQAGALTDEEFAELKRNVVRPQMHESPESGGYL